MFVSNQSEAVDTALSRGSVNASVNTTNIMMIPAEPTLDLGEASITATAVQREGAPAAGV